ncbi:uncharacterized protein LOC130527471 [Takifugu flavidus]|uniref:uncharacterized protein LOC130527471 n=1 Tax=Takifugu flavidus TaxID=433684 RepID=UPI00254486D9|nr:uncharacterized protein LOC130527471 [Takifugu flavidus]
MCARIILDPIENMQPPCVRHVAGVVKLLQKTAHLVMGHALTVLTTHSVVSLVSSAAFTMTSLRQTRMDKILTAPHITYTHEGINMADGIGEGEPHRCEKKVKKDEKIRVDLKAEPLKDPDEILFTDGCCFRHPQEGLKAAYAIVRKLEEDFEEVETGKITGKESAQLAELKAVIRALEISKGKKVTIYTDSAYVVGAIHLELCQWLQAGFNIASGSPIKHEAEMRQLAWTLMEPAEVAVVKCKGHSKENSLEGKGNEAADQAAKKAAGYKPSYNLLLVEKTVHEMLPRYDRERLGCDQEEASPHEKTVWKERGAVNVEGIWPGPDGRPVLPPGLVDAALEEARGLTHCGKPQMMRYLTHWWHPFLPAIVENYIRECSICTHFNVKSTIRPHEGKFSVAPMAGQEIIIDFTDMIDRVNGFRYLLVAVDAYTGWPEAVPVKAEDEKVLLNF